MLRGAQDHTSLIFHTVITCGLCLWSLWSATVSVCRPLAKAQKVLNECSFPRRLVFYTHYKLIFIICPLRRLDTPLRGRGEEEVEGEGGSPCPQQQQQPLFGFTNYGTYLISYNSARGRVLENGFSRRP